MTEQHQRSADPALERAEQHVKRVRDFVYHLMVFVLVNGLFVLLDLRAGEGSQSVLGLDWAFWLILFWGFGLVGHGVWVFFDDSRVRKAAGYPR